MKVIRRDFEFRYWIARDCRRLWADRELTPQCVNVLLLVVHPHILHQVVSNRRVRSVSTQHEVKGNLNLLGTGLAASLKPCLASLEIGPSEFMIKEELDVGHGFQDI
jgi:hypothetical protein